MFDTIVVLEHVLGIVVGWYLCRLYYHLKEKK